MAIVNHYRYSKKLYVIGRSAAKPLSPLCKDMGKVQRVDGSRPEGISNSLRWLKVYSSPYGDIRWERPPNQPINSSHGTLHQIHHLRRIFKFQVSRLYQMPGYSGNLTLI